MNAKPETPSAAATGSVAKDPTIRSAIDDPEKEMRSECPTVHLAWDQKGQLLQKWEQHWAGWERNFSGGRWRHWNEEVWRPVPILSPNND